MVLPQAYGSSNLRRQLGKAGESTPALPISHYHNFKS